MRCVRQDVPHFFSQTGNKNLINKLSKMYIVIKIK